MHMTAGELGLDPTAVRQRGASMSSGVDRLTDVSLEVFSTCVQSSEGDPETYVQRVADVARWSEQAGSKESSCIPTTGCLILGWCRTASSKTRLPYVPWSRSSPSICTRTPLRRWWPRWATCTGDAFI